MNGCAGKDNKKSAAGNAALKAGGTQGSDVDTFIGTSIPDGQVLTG